MTQMRSAMTVNMYLWNVKLKNKLVDVVLLAFIFYVFATVSYS